MSTIEHPTWCTPPRCEASLGRFHSAEPIIVGRQRGTSARLALRLYALDVAHPFVELVTGDHAEAHRCRTDLTIGQARALGAALRRVLDAVAAAPNPPHEGYKIGGRDL